MIKVRFLVTSTVEAVNGRTFMEGRAYWLRPDQYAFWDARGRIGPAPDDMPTENAPFSVMRAGRETFDVVGPSNRRLNTAALPWIDAEALRVAAEADWLANGRVGVTPPQPAPEPPPAVSDGVEAAAALTPPAHSVVDIEIDLAKAAADAGLGATEAIATDNLSVAKGPGGRWFVKRGDAIISKGFPTEEEAEADKAEIAAGRQP
jgi:hypothetical protein